MTDLKHLLSGLKYTVRDRVTPIYHFDTHRHIFIKTIFYRNVNEKSNKPKLLYISGLSF